MVNTGLTVLRPYRLPYRNSERGNNAGQIGSMVGMVVGSVIVGYFTGGAGTAAWWSAVALGASAGSHSPAGPAIERDTRFAVAPGVSAVVNPLLGVPFKLWGKDLEKGVDCFGLVQHLGHELCGVDIDDSIQFSHNYPGRLIWLAGQPGKWTRLVQALDIIVWIDPTAQGTLRELAAETERTDQLPHDYAFTHVAMSLNRKIAVTSDIVQGVVLCEHREIARTKQVLAVVRLPKAQRLGGVQGHAMAASA